VSEQSATGCRDAIADSSHERHKVLVQYLYLELLQRQPAPVEFGAWVHALDDGRDFAELFLEFRDCEERRQRTHNKSVPLFVSPGHYYSPVVDPTELVEHKSWLYRSRDLKGIDLNVDEQVSFLNAIERHYPLLDLKHELSPPKRYFCRNHFFGAGDAIVLATMILEHKPSCIVEIGSGFSSALILDTLDSMNDTTCQCTFIDPNPERLLGLLTDADRKKSTIIPQPIQRIGTDVLKNLRSNDILFIDSSHVVKTGSDVVFELTEMLPSLADGVIIHIHDIFYPFEYPEVWVFEENRSWNELYMLQAFLMYNKFYKILFFTDFMGKHSPSELQRVAPLFATAPGGGMWLKKSSGSQSVIA
jgi:hypothetical protein